MYSKIFAKMLDSSVWLESDATRIVWITMLVAMDQDGFCAFASPLNVAHRAHVSLDAAEAALAKLEGVDRYSSDPENDGRRLERVPGGWYVLNAVKYRTVSKRTDERAKTAERSRQYRLRRKSSACDARTEDHAKRDESSRENVTQHGSDVTKVPIVNQAEAYAEEEKKKSASASSLSAAVERLFGHYLKTFSRAKTYTLTAKRRKACECRLRDQMAQGCSPEEAEARARQAIDNLAASAWHRENGHIDWLDQIFRSPEEMEKRLNAPRIASSQAARQPIYGNPNWRTEHA